MNAETRPANVFRPGPWLQAKRFVPARFHRLLDPVEGFLYEGRGVPARILGHRLRFATSSPIPVSTVYRPPPLEMVEDLVFMSAVLESLRPGDTFLDAGSHFGLYAVGAAAIVGPSGRVVAFEPTPASAALVRRNVALNGLSARIEVQEAAVAEGPGTVEFVASGNSCQNAFAAYDPFRDTPGADPRRIVVRTVPLDDAFDPARRTVAKIDVEGAELLVLRGAPRLLASPARIFVELHAWGWKSVREGWDELVALARSGGRVVSTIDGAPIDQPKHQRVELVKRPVP
jgi:FkbM family methyltransferase